MKLENDSDIMEEKNVSFNNYGTNSSFQQQIKKQQKGTKIICLDNEQKTIILQQSHGQFETPLQNLLKKSDNQEEKLKTKMTSTTLN